MTNRDEEAQIKTASRQQVAANAVAKGVIDYFKVFEVHKDGKRIATFKTKDEAISHASKQQGVIQVFDKDQQKYVWENSRFEVYHKVNGYLSAFATEQDAINYAQTKTDTRVVEKATKWTIWSNFTTKKYVLKDQNNTVIGDYYDLGKAMSVAQGQSNRKIVRADSNEVIWTNISGLAVTRKIENKNVYGIDRYETSTTISKELYPNGFDANKPDKVVILSTGKEFADALSTGPLAAKYGNAPILLTEPTNLTKFVEEELIRLGAEKVVIVGGDAAISVGIEERLVALGLETERIFGIDRYETNQKIISELGSGVNGVFVASAYSFPDALAAAPIAAANNWAIVLTHKYKIEPEALAYMKGKKIVILGGDAVISDAVEDHILQNNNGGNVDRISGLDRYDTLAGLLWHFKDQVQSDNVYISTGTNFPDALAAAPLSIGNKAPLILVGNSANPNVQSFLMSYGETNKVQKLRIIGGVVPQGIVNSTNETLK
jgi:putative cell wall-binding protein